MIILLTGKPSAGKSSIINLLKQDNYSCFNIDDYVHEIYKVNNLGYILIKQTFGPEFVNHDGVDKEKLKQFIFDNPKEHQRLRLLIWPLIKQQLLRLKEANDFIIVEMSIFLLDRNYFGGIFDKVLVIERKYELLNFNPSQKDFYKFFDNSTIKKSDYVIQNNDDILRCYQDVKNTINLLNERNNNEKKLTKPLNDGYRINQNNMSRLITIWPTIYNCNFSSDINDLQVSFQDLVEKMLPYINISVGVDLFTYTNLDELLMKKAHLFIIQTSPFTINSNLLLFLENNHNHDTRTIVSSYTNTLHETLFDKLFKSYHFPFNLANNNFCIIEKTFFLVKSKFNEISNVYKWDFNETLQCLKLYFDVDSLVIIDDDNATKFNCLYDYMNVYQYKIFCAYDPHDPDNESFSINNKTLKEWCSQNKFDLVMMPVINFEKKMWLSYTNFFVCNNGVFLFNINDVMDRDFVSKTKLIFRNFDYIFIDNSLYKVKHYYGINMLIKPIPLIKF